jgi:hypothetical protein
MLFRPAILSLTFACTLARRIHVSVDGSDERGDGTSIAPFQSLSRAQLESRIAMSSAVDGDVTIAIRAGSYYQPSTLQFTQLDSGRSAGSRVRIVGGWPGDAPGSTIIHAGVALSNWTVSDASAGIWVAALPPGITDTRQVWDSASGAKIPLGSAAGGLGKGAAVTDTGYTASAAAVGWLLDARQNPSQVEFLYTGVGSSWTECRLRVSSVSVDANGIVNITMAEPAWSFHKRAYGQGLTLPVSATNLVSTLGPGEVAINGAVYIQSGAMPPDSTLLVPALDVLIRLSGTSWLSFEGITFAYAGWLEPNTGLGYVDMQSGYRIVNASADSSNDDLWVPVPGNIQVHGSQNISFAGCTFTSFGASALTVLDTSQSVSIANSTFVNIACSGVALGQVSDVNASVSNENGYFSVSQSLFDNIPNEFHDCAPILGGYIVAR